MTTEEKMQTARECIAKMEEAGIYSLTARYHDESEDPHRCQLKAGKDIKYMASSVEEDHFTYKTSRITIDGVHFVQVNS